jgi:hypothetical protein
MTFLEAGVWWVVVVFSAVWTLGVVAVPTFGAVCTKFAVTLWRSLAFVSLADASAFHLI